MKDDDEADRPPPVIAPHEPGGAVHRGLVALLRAEIGWLVGVLVRKKILPPGLSVELLPTEIWPVGEENRARELRADVVARLWPGPVPEHVTLEVIRRLGAIGLKIEVQLCKDERKRERWPEMGPAYVLVLGRQIVTVVLTFDQDIALWALKILRVTRSTQKVIVLTPDKLARSKARSEAIDPRTRPHLALLMAMLHGRGQRSLELLVNALRALRAMDPEEFVIYREMLLSEMGETRIMAAYQQLEPNERTTPYVLTRNDRRSFLFVNGQREGEAIGLARAVLGVLRERGLEPGEALEAEILACRDATLLQRWVARAATITRIDDLLAD
ncbi:hypothetical protein ACNOYE_15130 [Nannocystaceae bacterium ST9]